MRRVDALGAGLTDETLDALMRAIIDKRMEPLVCNAAIIASKIGGCTFACRYHFSFPVAFVF